MLILVDITNINHYGDTYDIDTLASDLRRAVHIYY